MASKRRKEAVMTALLDHPAVAHEWPCAEIHKTSTRYEVEVETPGFRPAGRVLPATGYGAEQLRELEETINATDCDA
jgi:hypothetical protein